MGWAELRKPADGVQIPIGKAGSHGMWKVPGGAQRTERAESRKTQCWEEGPPSIKARGLRGDSKLRQELYHLFLLCHDWSVPLHDRGPARESS